MEILLELLIPLFEFLAEIALQVGAEYLAQYGIRVVKAPFQDDDKANPVLAVLGYALFGMVAGGLSLWVFPASFLGSHALRVANLLVTPLASGAVMSLVWAWRRQRGLVEGMRPDRFAYDMVFAFSMTAVRFVFAQHAV